MLGTRDKVACSNLPTSGQYPEIPREICDPHGTPHKGQKSYTTKWLEKRYMGVVSNQLPGSWTPEVVVIDGMFMINTSPLSTHTNMKEYSTFLLRRFVLCYLIHRVHSVHIVFDNPGRQPSSPKTIEQKRRDNLANLHLTTNM